MPLTVFYWVCILYYNFWHDCESNHTFICNVPFLALTLTTSIRYCHRYTVLAYWSLLMVLVQQNCSLNYSQFMINSFICLMPPSFVKSCHCCQLFIKYQTKSHETANSSNFKSLFQAASSYKITANAFSNMFPW